MDSYGTNQGFTDYHTARGRDVSAYDDGDITAARLVASEWLDGLYAMRWPGLKTVHTQDRDWPRQGVIDREGYAVSSVTVPVQIENATYEVALRQLQSPGSLTTDFTPNKYSRVSIDGAISVQYAGMGGAADAQVQLPIVGQIIASLLWWDGAGSGMMGQVVRA